MAFFANETSGAFAFDDDDDENENFGTGATDVGEDGITDAEMGDLVALGLVDEEEAAGLGLGGGRRHPTRNLMLRYGVAHHRHVREVQQLSYHTKETEPRSVANALLQRLRCGRDEIRLGELRDAFALCVRRDKLRAWKRRPTSASSTFSLHQGGIDIADSNADVEEVEHAALVAGSSAAARPRSSSTANTNGCESEAQRRERVESALRELNVERLHKARACVRVLEARNEVHMSAFVGGMMAFFRALEEQDRCATVDSSRRSPREQPRQGEKEAAQKELEAAHRRAWLQQRMEAAQWPDDKDDAGGGGEGSDSSAPGGGTQSEHADPDGSAEQQGNRGPPGGAIPSSTDARDFMALGNQVAREGFEALFRAVDCDDLGRIEWDAFLRYLMEASLLGRVGARELETKDYELMHTEQCAAFAELVPGGVEYLSGRDQFLVCGHDVHLVANSRHHPVRCTITTPSDPIQQVPHYRNIDAAFMAPHQVIAVSCTDSTIKFFHIPGARGRLLLELRFPVNQTALLYHEEKNLIFVGSREGAVTSYCPRYSAARGLVMARVQQANPHTDAISCVAAITTEQSIVTASFDTTLCILDARKLVVLRRLCGHTSGVLRVAHNADLNILVSASYDTVPFAWLIALRDAPPLQLNDIAKPHIGHVVDVEVLSGTKTVATLCSKGVCKIWDLRSMTCQQTMHLFSQHYSADRGFKFHALSHTHDPPSGSNPLGVHRLFAFTRRRIFALEYNFSQRAAVLRNTADDEAIIAVAHSPQEGIYVTASSSTIRVWDEATSAIRDTFKCAIHAQHGGISALSLHPEGRMLFTGTRDGSLFARNVSTGSIMHHCFALHAGLVGAVLFCPAYSEATIGGGDEKCGLGDVIVSLGGDEVFFLRADLTNAFPMTEVSEARCVEFDEQSATILVGDADGKVHLVPTEVLSSTRSYPQLHLTIPKANPREITGLKVLPSLSLFVAADDDGHIALFSLRYHSTPYTCMRVWAHCSDSMAPPVVTALGWLGRKGALFVGDDVGFMTVYDLRDALKEMRHSVKTATVKQLLMRTPAGQSLLREAEKLHETPSLQRQHLSVTPPRCTVTAKQRPERSTASGSELGTPAASHLSAFEAFSLDGQQCGRQGEPVRESAGVGGQHSNDGPDSPLATPRVATRGAGGGSPWLGVPHGGSEGGSSSDHDVFLFTPSGTNLQPTAAIDSQMRRARRRQANTGMHLQMIAAAATAKHAVDLSKRVVSVINRWRAHDDPVTCVEVVESAKHDHLALLTASVDQCVSGWTLGGGVYIGALEQYGRAGIALTPAKEALDLEYMIENRARQRHEARRDAARMRAKGLLRRSGAKVMAAIPAALQDERHDTLNIDASTIGASSPGSLGASSLQPTPVGKTSGSAPPFTLTISAPGDTSSDAPGPSPTASTAAAARTAGQASFGSAHLPAGTPSTCSTGNSHITRLRALSERLKPRREVFYALVPNAVIEGPPTDAQQREHASSPLSDQGDGNEASLLKIKKSPCRLTSPRDQQSEDSGDCEGAVPHSRCRRRPRQRRQTSNDETSEDHGDAAATRMRHPLVEAARARRAANRTPFLDTLRASGNGEDCVTPNASPRLPARALSASPDRLPEKRPDALALLACQYAQRVAANRRFRGREGVDDLVPRMAAVTERWPLSQSASNAHRRADADGDTRLHRKEPQRQRRSASSRAQRLPTGTDPAPSAAGVGATVSSAAATPPSNDGPAPEPGDPRALLALLPHSADADVAARSIAVLARHVRHTFDSVYVPDEIPEYCVFSNQLPHEIVTDDIVALPSADRLALQRQLQGQSCQQQQKGHDTQGAALPHLLSSEDSVTIDFTAHNDNERAQSVMECPSPATFRASTGHGTRTATLQSAPPKRSLEQAPKRDSGLEGSGGDPLTRGGTPEKSSAPRGQPHHLRAAHTRTIDLLQYRAVMTPPPPKPMPGLFVPLPRKPRPAVSWKGRAATPDSARARRSLKSGAGGSRKWPRGEPRSCDSTSTHLVVTPDVTIRKSKEAASCLLSCSDAPVLISVHSSGGSSLADTPASSASSLRRTASNARCNGNVSLDQAAAHNRSRQLDRFVLDRPQYQMATVLAAVHQPPSLKASATKSFVKKSTAS